MSSIRIHVLHTGQVCVAPGLPFGGEDCSLLEASGLFTRNENRLWLPVSTYLIEHPKGLVLVDTGWNRAMSPEGTSAKKAQVACLGSQMLYRVNQCRLPQGAAINEQLDRMGITPSDLDYVLLTHLDCDHANGLMSVAEARHILASKDEIASVKANFAARIRYQERWWKGSGISFFDWNATEGPFGRSYDLYGDASIQCIAIPGHSDGLFAVKITGSDGRFVLLFSDGGYATKSWRDMIVSGLANNRADQKTSLAWIRDQSLDPRCVESLANHDSAVEPHVIELASNPVASDHTMSSDTTCSQAISARSPKEYDAVVFDLDGTLLYTLEDLQDSLNRTMVRFGLPELSFEEVRQRVGHGLAHLMAASIPNGIENADFDALLASFTRDYTTHCDIRTRPYDGILDMLGQLKEAGVALAIVSNKNDAAVGDLVQRYFSEFVDLAYGVTENKKPKPAPDTVLQALDELGVNRTHAVYVGDSDVDMQTAENAGMDYVLCAWGYHGRTRLESYGATEIIDEPSELIGLIVRG